MAKYQITIGYKAVIVVYATAENEADAKKLAIEKFAKKKDKMFSNGIELQDDNYKADGVLNMSDTWDMIES